MTLKGSGLRKDFLRLMDQLEMSYSLEYDVTKSVELAEDDFGSETFVRDFEKWDCEIDIKDIN